MRRWTAWACLLSSSGLVACEDPPGPPPAPPPTEVVASASASAPLDDGPDARQIALLRDAVKRDPRSIAKQMRLAHHCLETARWDEARDATNAVLALDPDHGDAQRVKRYLPRLRAAKGAGARRQIMMEMTGESLAALGDQLEGRVPLDEIEERSVEREQALRERLGITDELLKAQRARYATLTVRLKRSLASIEEPAAREAHIRELLAKDHERIGVVVELLDELIRQRRFADALEELERDQRTFANDLELQLFAHHLASLTTAKSPDRERQIVETLSNERLTLLVMIANAKIGKLKH